jgi:hypothetical protein
MLWPTVPSDIPFTLIDNIKWHFIYKDTSLRYKEIKRTFIAFIPQMQQYKTIRIADSNIKISKQLCIIT